MMVLVSGGVGGTEESGGERLPNPTDATNVENRCGFGGEGVRDCARLALCFSICWLTLFPMLVVLGGRGGYSQVGG